jgi:hypothetical protein
VLRTLGVGAQGALVDDVPLVERPRTLYAGTAAQQSYVWWGLALLLALISRIPRRVRGDPGGNVSGKI